MAGRAHARKCERRQGGRCSPTGLDEPARLLPVWRAPGGVPVRRESGDRAESYATCAYGTGGTICQFTMIHFDDAERYDMIQYCEHHGGLLNFFGRVTDGDLQLPVTVVVQLSSEQT